MKKLLLILLTLFIFSCTEKKINDFVVQKVEKSGNTTKYDIEQVTSWWSSNSIKIITISDCTNQFFNVGDTLVLVKKSDFKRLLKQCENDSVIKSNQIKK